MTDRINRAKLDFRTNGLDVSLSDFDGSARASFHARSRDVDTLVKHFPAKPDDQLGMTEEFYTVEIGNVDGSASICGFLTREQLAELVDKGRDLLTEV